MPKSWLRGSARASDVDDLPTSLNALLGARLDRLEGHERAALERGSIEGELFHHSAVVELSGNNVITEEIDGLTHKDLIRIAARHLRRRVRCLPLQTHPRSRRRLPRDDNEEASEAAVLHERFANWLEAGAGERVGEYHEILGYHLEQAHRYRTELGDPDQALAAAPYDICSRWAPRQQQRRRQRAANLLGEPRDRPPACRASSGSSFSFPTPTRSASRDGPTRSRRSPKSSTKRRPQGESGALRRMGPCAVS